MNKIWILILHQFKEWTRNGLLYIFVLVVAVLWAFSLYTGMQSFRATESIRGNAGKESRKQWLSQDRKHPHIAAHFGNFAFKHVNPLSIFDNGTDAFTGTYVYMEAHRQNDVLFSPAQSSSSLMRFGIFNISFLLQVIIPLFLIILTFNSVLSERLRGTLVFLKSSGVSNIKIIKAKIFAPLLLTGILVILLHFFSIVWLYANAVSFSPQELLKEFTKITLYLIYYFIICTLGVYISAISKDVKQSLVRLLGCWIFACIIFPKLVSNLALVLYPIPSNITFKEEIRKDIVNGIDGHNTSDKRAQQLISQLLKKYKVDSTHKLPFNVEGLTMFEGEKYSSKVYNEHFAKLNAVMINQQRLFSLGSAIDPLLGIKNLTMGISNTDYFNDQDFRMKAEAYRMNFVQLMNSDMAKNSKENNFGTYKIGPDLFKEVPEFSFKPAGLISSLGNYLIELTVLLLLFVSSWILIGKTANKL